MSQGIIVIHPVIFQRLMSNVSFIPLAPQVTETPLQDFNHDFQADFFMIFIDFTSLHYYKRFCRPIPSAPVVTWQTLVPTCLYYP